MLILVAVRRVQRCVAKGRIMLLSMTRGLVRMGAWSLADVDQWRRGELRRLRRCSQAVNEA